jgi:hypothetical protein
VSNLWQILQDIASITRHVGELQTRIDRIESSLRAAEEKTSASVRAIEVDLAALRAEVSAQKETQRETVRAEIATAIGELRVRYAEEQARRRLDEG